VEDPPRVDLAEYGGSTIGGVDEPLTPEVKDAVHDLHQYLSDAVAPLIVTDAVSLLMEQAPALVAAEIHNWTLLQYEGVGAKMPVSDFLFHAIKKIAMLSDFGLIPKESLFPWLGKLTPLVLTYCPEADRPFLVQNLSRLGHEQPLVATPITVIHRQMGTDAQLASNQQPSVPPTAHGSPVAGAPLARPQAPGPSAPPQSPEESARMSRLLTLLLDRYERELGVAPGGAPNPTSASTPARPELTGQIIAAVAQKAADGPALDQDLARLRDLGIDASMDQVFKFLGESLPGWTLPAADGAPDGAAIAPPAAPAEAMRRIIDSAPNATEGAHRLHEMVKAAVEQFNEGSLARAVTMFELAEAVATDNKVKPSVVEGIRRGGHEFLDPDRIRFLADAPDKHRLLRKVLAFYTALRPDGLLEELQTALKRDRRRLLLLLVEVHGPAGREACVAWLERSFTGVVTRDDWHIQRNLVYLIRRIPRPADVAPEPEIELFAALADPSRPVPLLKEVLAALGALRHEKAEQALLRFLSRLEEKLIQAPAGAAPGGDVISLLDRTVSALVRLGSAGARRAVVSHGLRRDPRLGDTLARMAELGTLDLSADRGLVDRLLKALQDEMPKKVLGVVVKQNSKAGAPIIRALAGTPLPAVREAFEQILERHPEEDFADAAEDALAAPPGAPLVSSSAHVVAPPAPVVAAPSFSGDLELFGLPNLFQSLSTAGAIGTLTLSDATKEPIGTVALAKGKLMGARVGSTQGRDAVFQLLEKPIAATFSFVTAPIESLRKGSPGEGDDLLSLMLEGMRRYDELQRASALVPDAASFKATGTAPTSLPDERDGKLVSLVWSKATAGATPAACELTAETDAYRVRRLLAHWVEEGALKPRTS
jgi:hypothetical protein